MGPGRAADTKQDHKSVSYKTLNDTSYLLLIANSKRLLQRALKLLNDRNTVYVGVLVVFFARDR